MALQALRRSQGALIVKIPRVMTTPSDHPIASHYIDVVDVAWEKTELPGIEMKLHVHNEVERTYVIEGQLVDEQGRALLAICLATCWKRA